jgi:soluble lytic murein transglycosylase-like protein
MSWGLMQIMGSVARQYGFKGNLSSLTEPEINIEIGCKHFVSKYSVEPKDMISAYNAGSPKKTPEGLYVNQGYVDKVCAAWTRLRLNPIPTKP